MKRPGQVKPEARSEGLIVEDFADELIIYDLDQDKAHCLNPPAALVWKRCDGKNSVSELSRYIGGGRESAADEEIVRLALDELGRAGLLRAPEGAPRISRRDVLFTLGSATLALPFVTTILAPTAAEAASGVCQSLSCTDGTSGDAFCAAQACGPCVAGKCT